MSSSTICIDASLVVRLLVDSTDEHLPRLWLEWIEAGSRIAAPTLLFYEVTNALYRYQRQGYLSGAAVEKALAAALSLPIQLPVVADRHRAAVKMAVRFSLPATYDAHYLALAEELGAEFWSADRRLVRQVEPHLNWVHLYA